MPGLSWVASLVNWRSECCSMHLTPAPTSLTPFRGDASPFQEFTYTAASFVTWM